MTRLPRLAPQIIKRATRARGEPPAPKGNLAGMRVTTCKLCPEGIYVDQPRTWLRKPCGLSHDSCIERAIRERVIEIWA